jgi:hypothetical protein
MDTQRENATESKSSGRILAVIESLEERVSALAVCERQTVRVRRVPATPAVGVIPTVSKPGHADQFKVCEETRGIATTATFRYDEVEQRWTSESRDDDKTDVPVAALLKITAASEARQI